jgi:hypothetical protein
MYINKLTAQLESFSLRLKKLLFPHSITIISTKEKVPIMRIRRTKKEAANTGQVKLMLDKDIHLRGKAYAQKLGVSFSILVESLLRRQMDTKRNSSLKTSRQ